MLRYLGAFLTFTVWDWIATAGTRLVVDQSYWAVVLSTIYAVVGFYGVRYMVQGRLMVLAVLAGAVVGTALGINIP